MEWVEIVRNAKSHKKKDGEKIQKWLIMYFFKIFFGG